MTLVGTCLVLALTRAEIIERMRAPVVTYADGFVQVYADCPEDMRREYQSPVGRFAADTAQQLYRGLRMRPVTFRQPALMIHLGDVRTNLNSIVTRVSTNGTRVISRLYLKSPGHADVAKVRLEVVKAFYRAVRKTELTDEGALLAYRRCDPAYRVWEQRRDLEEWLVGKGGHDDEYAIGLMRRVLEPGVASKREILTFASRLHLYPNYLDQPFVGMFDCLSFRDALEYGEVDPGIRIVAHFKAAELPVFAGGRGEDLMTAGESYTAFLREFVKGDKTREELSEMLDKADAELRRAWENAK